MASAKQFNYPVWTMVVREKSGGPTLQEQLFIQLRRLIVNGQLARGARLPASRTMAADLAISRNTVNMAYDRLAAEGYIERRADPNDGRAHCLHLTAKAAPVLERIWHFAEDSLAEALQGFQESERQQLFSLLNRVRDNLVAATSEALPASSAGRRTRKAA